MSAYSDLNEGQKKFVNCYVDGAISGADAVVEAGFAHFEGFSEHDVALRLLGSPKIQKAIAERVSAVHDKGIASDMWLVRKVVDYLNCDYTDIYDADGALLAPKLWPEALRKMIKKVKFNDIGRVEEVQFEGKTKFYELLGRTDIIGAFNQENESNETLVIIRDMTQKIEASQPVDVEHKTIG